MAKRRADGEGSLFWSETEQTWIGEIILPNGKKKRKRNKKQQVVKAWLLDQRKAVSENRILPNENLTLGTFLDRFITDVASLTLRPSTLRSYDYLIRDHIKPELGHIRLVALRPDDLQSLYRKKLDEGLSRRTVQYIHAVVRRALNQAVKWELIYRNPTDAVTPPRPKKEAPKTLSAEEAKPFFAVVRDHPYFPLYLIATLMGLRKSEILGLRWQDISFEQGTLSINHIVSEIQGQIYEGAPKTESSRRTVVMPEVVREALLKHRALTSGKQGLVFTTSTGNPISQRNLTRHFHASLKKAGLPRIRFHDLRHTAATLLLQENVHPKIVQSMLGHASITQTLDTYSHVIPSVGKKAADKMDELFKP
jgi:integrase